VFFNADSFNGDLSKWKTSKVTNPSQYIISKKKEKSRTTNNNKISKNKADGDEL
jgi:surface protein